MTLQSANNILVCVAWPYANGDLHLGHVAGAYLPADIFARYHRQSGSNVLMVSGADAHGTPILVRAEQEQVSPAEIVERYSSRFRQLWDSLSISFDLFTSTGTANHAQVVTDFIKTLNERGYLYKRQTIQLFDPERHMFLPDRYVEGTCPHCGYSAARGDQCENCGRTLDAVDLINPISRVSGASPVRKESEHVYFSLSKLEKALMEWVDSKNNWRPAVLNWTKSFIDGGLEDRAISRDLAWGISLPEELGLPDKKVYVWFEAVIGYLSATVEFCRSASSNWRDWWNSDNVAAYYFVGKDNVPFHTIIWPAMLIAHENLNLPAGVPANNYVLMGGRKASKSAGIGGSALDYVNHFGADSLRYALATVLPENDDVEISDSLLIEKINGELANGWGNLVSRTLTLAHKYLDAVIPSAEHLEWVETQPLVIAVDQALVEAGQALEAVELKLALRKLMAVVQDVNGYLASTEPWKTARTDLDAAQRDITVALSAIAGLATGLTPYLPESSAKVLDALGVEPSSISWSRPMLKSGSSVKRLPPLYNKLEKITVEP